MAAHQQNLAIDMESIKRGLGANSLASMASFYIPQPVLETKARALKTQTLLYLGEVVFGISAVLGIWVIFDMKTANLVQVFGLTDELPQLSKSAEDQVLEEALNEELVVIPDDANPTLYFPIVPKSAQACVYAVLAFACIGFLSSLVVAYSSKVSQRLSKVLLAIANICSIGIFFIAIAAQILFEESMNQMEQVNEITDPSGVQNVDASGRGYGYSALVIMWILAIPLTLLSITTFFGVVHKVWENQWRETLRKSMGANIPQYIAAHQPQQDGRAPADIKA